MSPHVVMVGSGPLRAADELRSRGIDRITVVVDDPESVSTDRQAEAVLSCGFSGILDQPSADLGALDARLDQLQQCLDTGHWSLDDPALAVRDAIADSELVLIAGSGFGPHDPAPLYEAAAVAAIARHLSRPVVVATHFGPRVSHWVRLADIVEAATVVSDVEALVTDLRVGTGLPVVVVPQTGSLDPLARAVANGLVVLPIETAEQAASVVRHAALVVAYDRYGAVLGHSAAIPTLAVAIDADAQRELGVIQRRAGLGDWCVSALGEGQVAAAAAEAWERRAEITGLLNLLVPAWASTVSNAWDIVATAAKGKRPPKWVRPTEPEQLVSTRPWNDRNADLVRVVLAAGDRLAAVEGELGMSRRVVTGLRADLARIDQERAAALDRIAVLEASVTQEQAAAAAARDLVAEQYRATGADRPLSKVTAAESRPTTLHIAEAPSKPFVLRRGGARVARAVRHALGNRGE